MRARICTITVVDLETKVVKPDFVSYPGRAASDRPVQVMENEDDVLASREKAADEAEKIVKSLIDSGAEDAYVMEVFD